ncbi:MAG: hypothetical protein AAGK17_02055 [Pseudomonadota bacterium]
MGAAVTGLLGLLPKLLFLPEPEISAYLTVYDRGYEESELTRIEEIASTSGQLLRECGAKKFLLKEAKGVGSLPYSLIKIAPENDHAIQCIFDKAPAGGYSLHVQMLTDQQAEIY